MPARAADAVPLGSRFAKLWAASTISALGSGLATIAAPLYVVSRTTNPLVVSAARQRLGVGSVGYGLLFTCEAAGGILGSIIGDQLIGWISATWTIRIGLLVEAGLHLTLATTRSPYVAGAAFFVFGIHASLWTIASSSLRQRLTPPEMLGRVSSSNYFIVAGGNCVGALLAGTLAHRFGITAPYWVGFVVAVIVAITTWQVFNRSAVAQAYAAPAEPAASSAC